MKVRVGRVVAPMALALVLLSTSSWAGGEDAGWRNDASESASKADLAKALSARSVASRGTVTSGITLYGGFDPAASGTIYILVRGNSMGTLGVTQNFLDLPTLRLYNAQGQELISSSGSCGSGPVSTYYQNVRGAPVHARDACVLNTNASPGPVTFTITPSATSSRTGEVLFEVTLGP